jgi:hypothetical protein
MTEHLHGKRKRDRKHRDTGRQRSGPEEGKHAWQLEGRRSAGQQGKPIEEADISCRATGLAVCGKSPEAVTCSPDRGSPQLVCNTEKNPMRNVFSGTVLWLLAAAIAIGESDAAKTIQGLFG